MKTLSTCCQYKKQLQTIRKTQHKKKYNSENQELMTQCH